MGKFDGILLVSDLDGTLISGGKVSEVNLAAIRYFIDNGGMFTTATGRAPSFVKQMRIPVNVPLITCNGSVICDFETHEVIKHYECKEYAIAVAKEAARNENTLIIEFFTPNGNLSFNKPFSIDFDNITETVYKVVFVFNTADAALCAKSEFCEKYGNWLAFERSWPVGLEARPVEGGKGNCLKKLKKLTGAKITIGVGDWENDESLLKAADISYAPESGHPDIKAIADRVTVACNEHVIAAIVKDLDEKGTVK